MKTKRIVNQPPRGNISNPYCRARVRAGLTQDEACLKLYISKTFLSEIENGKHNPAPDLAVAMGKLYGDDSLPKKICREICAIGQEIMSFDLNLETVMPLMSKRLNEIQGIFNQLATLFQTMDSKNFKPEEWKLIIDYAGRIRRFTRDMEVLEVSLEQMLDKKAEKKTAYAAT